MRQGLRGRGHLCRGAMGAARLVRNEFRICARRKSSNPQAPKNKDRCPSHLIDTVRFHGHHREKGAKPPTRLHIWRLHHRKPANLNRLHPKWKSSARRLFIFGVAPFFGVGLWHARGEPEDSKPVGFVPLAPLEGAQLSLCRNRNRTPPRIAAAFWFPFKPVQETTAHSTAP